MDILGTNVAAAVVPFSTEDQFPTHFAEYGKGGWRSVLTKDDLDEIPSVRREDGMAVFVVEESSVYVHLDGAFKKFSGVGDFDDIKGRLSKLETNVTGFQDRLTGIESTISEITNGLKLFDSVLMKSGDTQYRMKIVTTSGSPTIAIEEVAPVVS